MSQACKTSFGLFQQKKEEMRKEPDERDILTILMHSIELLNLLTQ